MITLQQNDSERPFDGFIRSFDEDVKFAESIREETEQLLRKSNRWSSFSRVAMNCLAALAVTFLTITAMWFYFFFTGNELGKLVTGNLLELLESVVIFTLFGCIACQAKLSTVIKQIDKLVNLELSEIKEVTSEEFTLGLLMKVTHLRREKAEAKKKVPKS